MVNVQRPSGLPRGEDHKACISPLMHLADKQQRSIFSLRLSTSAALSGPAFAPPRSREGAQAHFPASQRLLTEPRANVVLYFTDIWKPKLCQSPICLMLFGPVVFRIPRIQMRSIEGPPFYLAFAEGRPSLKIQRFRLFFRGLRW